MKNLLAAIKETLNTCSLYLCIHKELLLVAKLPVTLIKFPFRNCDEFKIMRGLCHRKKTTSNYFKYTFSIIGKLFFQSFKKTKQKKRKNHTPNLNQQTNPRPPPQKTPTNPNPESKNPLQGVFGHKMICAYVDKKECQCGCCNSLTFVK